MSSYIRCELPKENSRADGFFCERTGYTVGPLNVVLSKSDAHAVARTDREASASDHWVLIQRRKGWADIDFGSHVYRFNGRSLELRSLTRHFSGHVGANDTMFLCLPRDKFIGMEAILDGICQANSAQFIHPLLADYCSHLSTLLPGLAATKSAIVADATIAMVQACTSHSAGAVAAAQNPIMATRFEIARRYIEENLLSPSLSLESVQAKLAVSRRQLYKIFEGQGGVAQYIRARRLNACRAAIASPGDTRTIREIAAVFGFIDAAQFSRLFRAEFGFSASEARDEVMAERPRRRTFIDWLTQPRPA